MNMQYTEEEKMFKDIYRNFFITEGHVSKINDYNSKEGRLFDLELWRKLLELGSLKLNLPEDYNGHALGEVVTAIVVEEMGYAGYYSPFIENLICFDLFKESNYSFHESLIKDIARGEQICTLFMDHSRLRVSKVNNSLCLTGKADLVSYADTATYYTLLIDKLCIVLPFDSPGIRTYSHKDISGSNLHTISFENVTINLDRCINISQEKLTRIKAKNRLLKSIYLIGLSQGSFEISNIYTKKRKQFNVTLSKFQSISFEVSRMAAHIEASKIFAHCIVNNLEANKDIGYDSYQLQVLSAELVKEVTSKTIHLLGAFGMSKTVRAQEFYRRGLTESILIGSKINAKQKIIDTIVGKELID